MKHLPEKIITIVGIILHACIVIETIQRWHKTKGEK